MRAGNENRSVLGREIKLVPLWAWVLATIPFVAAQWFFNFEILRHSNPPPPLARPLLGLLAGGVAAIYLLLVGYVNRDAKRRGMSPLLWTLVAIFVPNLLGILLYFVLRQPPARFCPGCGGAVRREFNFCPRCSLKLAPNCRACQRVVGVDDDYCPYCGGSLASGQTADSQEKRPG